MNDIGLGLQLMCYGLLGIFIVCAVFILVIKGIMKFFPYKAEQGTASSLEDGTGKKRMDRDGTLLSKGGIKT